MPVLSTATPAEAASRHCKDVTIQVTNNTGEEIKIVDIDYFDPSAIGDWRSEPIGSHRVDNGDTWEKTRRLEKVNRKETQIRVDYKLRDIDGDWGYTRHADSDLAVCRQGSTFSVSIQPLP